MIDRKKGRGLVTSLLIICFGFLVLGGVRSGDLRRGSNSSGRPATWGEKADPADSPESNRSLATGNLVLDFISWVIDDTPAYLEVRRKKMASGHPDSRQSRKSAPLSGWFLRSGRTGNRRR